MKNSTSWQKVAPWYNKLVGDEGHYYHEHLIIPNSLRLLNLKTNDSILDLGCGQGVLANAIPKDIFYTGIDNAGEMIRLAQSKDRNTLHRYLVWDAMRDLKLNKKDFTHAAMILSLQNMESPDKVFLNAVNHLSGSGKLLLVINHPCFRIPRQSSWGIDAANKIQYRRINRYLSPLKIPINMTPGQSNTKLTWSFHYPLSYYSESLLKNGFVIEKIEEWSSDKESAGRQAKMENRSRAEIPLFMAILVKKAFSG